MAPLAHSEVYALKLGRYPGANQATMCRPCRGYLSQHMQQLMGGRHTWEGGSGSGGGRGLVNINLENSGRRDRVGRATVAGAMPSLAGMRQPPGHGDAPPYNAYMSIHRGGGAYTGR